MPGLVPGIHELEFDALRGVDGRDKPDKPGHDSPADVHEVPRTIRQRHPITIRVPGPSRTRSRRKLSGASATQPAVGRNPGLAKCRKTALPRPATRGRAL